MIIAALGAFFSAAPAESQRIMRTISLSWNAAIDPSIVGYRLTFGTQSGYYTDVIDVGNQTTAEVPNLVEGTTYFFAVIGYTANDIETEPSEEIHYMPNAALILNVSTRGVVLTGDNVMIVGFIIGGSGEKRMIIRALGPSLAASGLSGTLDDPALELYGPEGLIGSNDNWRDGDPDAISALGFAPTYDSESAIVTNLKPGNYTAIVRGASGGTGLALLEVYDYGTVVP